LIIDDEKGHPDLLGKKELGRELEIKGVVTLFHGRIDSLPLTKRLVGVCIWETLWLYTTFF